jgi:CRISPR type III-B/RAMP module-associated protein Cmr5
MSLKTQNQERAACVMEHIESLKKSDYSEKIASYILTNGLLPTLAFLKEKEKEKEKSSYRIICKHLKNKGMVLNETDALKELAECDSNKLRLATREALELANWIRRLVKSESEE